VSILSQLLHANREGVLLMTRIFPRGLYKRVITDKQLFKQCDWEYEQWKDFFKKLQKNFNTARDQWNETTRQEALEQLQVEIRAFISITQQKHFDSEESLKARLKGSFSALMAEREGRISKVPSSSKFTRNRELISHPSIYAKNSPKAFQGSELQRKDSLVSRGGTCKQLKWNYQDFEVEYLSLSNKHKVYKYYLKPLLVERPGKIPYFTEIIVQPTLFWNVKCSHYLLHSNCTLTSCQRKMKRPAS